MEIEREQWECIPGIPSCYQVSTLGRIRRVRPPKNGKMLPPRMLKAHAVGSSKKSGKTLTLTWYRPGKSNGAISIIECICRAFLGGISNREVWYKDGNKNNLRLDNLVVIGKEAKNRKGGTRCDRPMYVRICPQDRSKFVVVLGRAFGCRYVGVFDTVEEAVKHRNEAIKNEQNKKSLSKRN
jgi:hypothetical protein